MQLHMHRKLSVLGQPLAVCPFTTKIGNWGVAHTRQIIVYIAVVMKVQVCIKDCGESSKMCHCVKEGD